MNVRKIIFLINPISGVARKESLKDLIYMKMELAGIPFELIQTSRDGNYISLREKIIRESITDIIVCGGDGTMSAVTGAFRDLPLNFGIIPMGSGNGLAFTANIPKSPAKALDLIIAGNASYVDGFEVNGKFSCMLCGIGFDALVAHQFARTSRRGLKTYIKLSAYHFFTAKPYEFTVESEGLSFTTEAFLISVANSNQFGNNFTIAPQASLSDGLLDIVIVNKMNKFLLPFYIAKQMTGNNMVHELDDTVGKKSIIYFQTRELKIRNRSSAPIHIDGDPASGSSEINIHVIPDAYRLLHLPAGLPA